MVPQDEANAFNSTLIKIERMLEKLQSINIDISVLDQRIQKIKVEVEKEIEAFYEQYGNIESPNNPLQDGYIAKIYEKGISKLDKIQAFLIGEYNVYVKIDGKYHYIINQFDSITPFNLEQFIKEAKSLLKEINFSSNIDWKMEKNLFQNIYQLIYQLIKKEFQLTGTSQLLLFLTNVDIPKIEELLLREIQELQLPNNSKVLNKLRELEMNGLETNYLDEELLRLLSKFEEPQSIKKDESNLQSTKASSECSKLKVKIGNQENKMEETSQEIKELNLNIRKKRLLIAGYFSALVAVFGGGCIVANKVSKEKNYYTTEETLANGKTLPPKHYYESSQEDKVFMIKHNPYEKIGWWEKLNAPPKDNEAKFTSEIETYDVSEIKLENLEDYLTLDLESLGVPSETYLEYKVYLTPTDTFEEPYLEVKRVTHDLKKINYDLDLLKLLMLVIDTILVEIMIHWKIMEKRYNNWKTSIKYDQKALKKALEKN